MSKYPKRRLILFSNWNFLKVKSRMNVCTIIRNVSISLANELKLPCVMQFFYCCLWHSLTLSRLKYNTMLKKSNIFDRIVIGIDIWNFTLQPMTTINNVWQKMRCFCTGSTITTQTSSIGEDEYCVFFTTSSGFIIRRRLLAKNICFSSNKLSSQDQLFSLCKC